MDSADSSTGLDFSVSVAEGPEGRAVVTIFGELDAATSPRTRDALAEGMEIGSDVEVDMRACSFVDSTGIAAIVWAAVRLARREDKLFLVGASDRVRGILDLAGVAGHAAVVLNGPPKAA